MAEKNRYSSSVSSRRSRKTFLPSLNIAKTTNHDRALNLLFIPASLRR